MDFKHTCKVFDDNKKISDEDINYILEIGRKFPSSFGMEAWKFLRPKSKTSSCLLESSSYERSRLVYITDLVKV